jgi:phosphatidylinositol glycan class T
LRHEPVCLHVSDKATVYSAGNAVERKDGSGFKRCFTLSEDPLDSFELVYPLQHTPPPATPLKTPKLYAERSFTGYGAERGGVQAVLTNPSTTEDVEIVYLEALPWFMRVFLHTLKVTKTTGDQIDIPSKELIQEMYYLPAVDRSRGTQLEIRLRIPASSTVKLGYDFEKAILRYTEYPPDANRGFDVPAAVVKVLGPSGEEEEVLRTTSLLLSLPTPDFSMPYNVIIFTSTVMALAFGFVFNLMVRRFVGVEEAEGWNLRAARAKFVTRVKEKLARLQKTRGVSVPRINVGKVTGGKVD